jgi:hypothetical protein
MAANRSKSTSDTCTVTELAKHWPELSHSQLVRRLCDKRGEGVGLPVYLVDCPRPDPQAPGIGTRDEPRSVT